MGALLFLRLVSTMETNEASATATFAFVRLYLVQLGPIDGSRTPWASLGTSRDYPLRGSLLGHWFFDVRGGGAEGNYISRPPGVLGPNFGTEGEVVE